MKLSTNLKPKRATEVVKRLRAEIPNPECALIHEGPYQLLIATMLSAQCTDARVNLVTPALFKAAPDASAMVQLGEKKIRELVKSINFFNTKAKNIYLASKILVDDYAGNVPAELAKLVELPGVGRKTANVVLGNAFDVPGLVVDTHVKRLANRLGLTKHQDPVDIEHDLEKIVPREDWVDLAHLLILHGRATCTARAPRCDRCVLADLCPSRGIGLKIRRP